MLNKFIDTMHQGYGTWVWANRNVAKAAQKIGWEVLNISLGNSQIISSYSAEKRTIYVEQILARVKPGDIVVHQFPFPPAMGWELEISYLAGLREKQAVVGAFIHDIVSWMVGNEEERIKQEAHLMNFDFLIVATKAMGARLRESGFKGAVFTNNLFDYELEAPRNQPTFKNQIYFAGTLNKAKDLLDWPYEAKLITYDTAVVHGEVKSEKDWVEEVQRRTAGKNVEIRAYLEQEELSEAFHSGFGLVYYSEEDFSAKDYAKYNAPNKLSLYLAVGLPVIVERYLPSAAFIEKHSLGFVVDSLDEIDSKISSLTEASYDEMVGRVNAISELIRRGFFAQRVLSEVSAFNF